MLAVNAIITGLFWVALFVRCRGGKCGGYDADCFWLAVAALVPGWNWLLLFLIVYDMTKGIKWKSLFRVSG
jgi:hypothetical protein